MYTADRQSLEDIELSGLRSSSDCGEQRRLRNYQNER
jgi:hypothetical protein